MKFKVHKKSQKISILTVLKKFVLLNKSLTLKINSRSSFSSRELSEVGEEAKRKDRKIKRRQKYKNK